MEETLVAWGLSASIDLHDCNPSHIKNPVKMREFVIRLCDLIGMKRYGETRIERFGDGSLNGCSLFQFIETSSITAHFDETQDRAFIDIFSCKPFDTELAAQFSQEFFEARECTIKTLTRC